MVFEVDGVDILPYIEENGIEVTREDLDSAESGRTTMNGLMHRARVAVKTKINVTCLPLPTSKSQILLNAIYPPFVEVRYEDPREGIVTKMFYSNNVPATAATVYDDGTVLWTGIKFPLIEQ